MTSIGDAVTIYDTAKRIIESIQAAEGAPAQWDLLRARLRISVDILENITENYNRSEAEIQLHCERQLFKVFGPDGTAPKYRKRVQKIGEKLPEKKVSKLDNFWHKYKWPFGADAIEKDVNDLKVWEEDFRELREAIANALAQDTNRQISSVTQRISEEQLEELYDSLSSVVPWQKIRQDYKICSKSPPDWILQEDRYRDFVDVNKPVLEELWGVWPFWSWEDDDCIFCRKSFAWQNRERGYGTAHKYCCCLLLQSQIHARADHRRHYQVFMSTAF